VGRALREAKYRNAERDLRAFVEQAWRVVEPNTPYIPTWHIDAICDHLMAVSLGWLTRLIINIPPRHTKTRVVSTYWPAWEWIQWPHIASIYTGSSLSNVLSEAVDSRRLMRSEWYQQRWGDRFEFSGDQDTKGYYENDQGGKRWSLSLAIDPVGKGGDKVVNDDPNGLDEADKGDALERAYQDSSRYRSRLNDPKRGSLVLVQQRIGDMDVTGRFLTDQETTGEDWTVLMLPAEFNPRRICVLNGTRARPVDAGDPRAALSPWGTRRDSRTPLAYRPAYRRVDFRDPRDVENEPLNPDRFPTEVLNALRATQGSFVFDPQYNQDPQPREGAMFPRARWRFYKRPPMAEDGRRPAFDEVMQSWDLAFKDLESSDYVVGGVVGRQGPNVYVIDVERDRLSASNTIKRCIQLTRRWPTAVRKLVEDKANGPAVVDMLKTRLPGLLLVNPEGGKESRASAMEPFHESGNLWLPDPAGCEWPDGQGGWRPLDTRWVEKFMHEHERFPKGANDDQVDMLSQAVVYWLEKLQAAHPLVELVAVGRGGPSPWQTPSRRA
jgi:predicted phage terminase large subunit-like protein